jgi:hypothetical protein
MKKPKHPTTSMSHRGEGGGGCAPPRSVGRPKKIKTNNNNQLDDDETPITSNDALTMLNLDGVVPDWSLNIFSCDPEIIDSIKQENVKTFAHNIRKLKVSFFVY